MTERSVPILPSGDLRETLTFYEALGFENRGASPEEWDYLIIGRGGIEIHFIAATAPHSTSASCYAFVDEAQALYDEWVRIAVFDPATGSQLFTPMDTEYGMREFEVVDPSGNRLRVGSPMH